jgi:hypothetical protein
MQGEIKTEEQIVRCIQQDVNAQMDAKGLTSNSILDRVLCTNWGISLYLLES